MTLVRATKLLVVVWRQRTAYGGFIEAEHAAGMWVLEVDKARCVHAAKMKTGHGIRDQSLHKLGYDAAKLGFDLGLQHGQHLLPLLLCVKTSPKPSPDALPRAGIIWCHVFREVL